MLSEVEGLELLLDIDEDEVLLCVDPLMTLTSKSTDTRLSVVKICMCMVIRREKLEVCAHQHHHQARVCEQF